MKAFIKAFNKLLLRLTKKGREKIEADRKKKKDLEEKKFKTIKKQYNAILQKADKQADEKNLSERKRKNKRDSICPKCGSENVNDRIKRMQGSMRGEMSGHYTNLLLFGSGAIHGHTSSSFDTNEVNKCNDCEHEWKKDDYSYIYTRHVIEDKLNDIKYFLKDIKEAKDPDFDPKDLEEKFTSKEEKSKHLLDKAIDSYYIKYINDFWGETSTEVIEKIAKKYLSGYSKVWFFEEFNIEAIKEYTNLKTLDEFIKDEQR